MKLYFLPGSCSMAPHIALVEAGLEFELDRVNHSDKTCKDGSFLLINPKGSVPALKLDSGRILTECAVLLQYIAEQNLGKNLMPPAGSFEHYKCQEWLNYIATELHKACIPYWSIDGWTTSKGVAAEVKEKIKSAIGLQLTYVATEIQKTGYLVGSQLTVADIYLYTFLSWHKYFDLDLTQWPTLKNYFNKIADRPSVQKVRQAEGLQ